MKQTFDNEWHILSKNFQYNGRINKLVPSYKFILNVFSTLNNIWVLLKI